MSFVPEHRRKIVNCSASVEPASVVVDAVPLVIAF
jgi:hypothetical protein